MATKKKPRADTGVETPAIMTAMIAANPVLARAMMDMMTESARFVTDRLQADMKTQKALMACRTPAQLMEVQTEFLNTAMQQYADQAARVVDMTMKASKDVTEDLKTGHSRGYDDVPI